MFNIRHEFSHVYLNFLALTDSFIRLNLENFYKSIVYLFNNAYN
ncbi:hypothetical protein GCM10011384_18630 [Psychrobacillus lasiicapitis]|nr:hypothetical protein GCM10011384_18630 [Psychrobacillus lasiicapitis]